MNVLVLGSGGREHALTWAISKSAHIDELYVAPGNGGTAGIATNVPLNAEDAEAVLNRILYCPEQSPSQLRCQPPLHKGAFVPTAEDAHDGTLRHILFCTKQIARKVFVSYRIKLDKER